MLKNRKYIDYIALVLIFLLQICLSVKEFDDSVLFRLSWPGSIPDLSLLKDHDVIVLTTTDNEKYQCTLPVNIDHEKANENPYTGASALELLQPLFLQFSCSYRLEQFWTYELCHGRYIKQYHDEKDLTNSRKLRRQEYILGRFSTEQYIKAAAKLKEENAMEVKPRIPTIKIDTQELPYFEVEMTDGTACDLIDRIRSTRVLYVCYPESNNEIFSVRELSSCEYEMIVLTPLLCSHTSYKLEETPEHDIQCHSMDGSRTRPLQLEIFESENKKFTKKTEKAQAAYLKKLKDSITKEAESVLKDSKVPKEAPNDEKLMDDFLKGIHCLHGGSNWWKFEFCNWKKVLQYHEYEDKRRIEVILGEWDKAKHLNWLRDNPHKRPKKGQVSHLYTGGTMCDITGKPRQVEVKMKCKEFANHPNAVSLYLLEPKSCEYILVVESSILCQLIATADEQGLFREIPDIPENG